MDEGLSWRARLARSNINILDMHDGMVFFEFTYHPKPGTFKWCKTLMSLQGMTNNNDLADGVIDEVLALRKELEG